MHRSNNELGFNATAGLAALGECIAHNLTALQSLSFLPLQYVPHDFDRFIPLRAGIASNPALSPLPQFISDTASIDAFFAALPVNASHVDLSYIMPEPDNVTAAYLMDKLASLPHLTYLDFRSDIRVCVLCVLPVLRTHHIAHAHAHLCAVCTCDASWNNLGQLCVAHVTHIPFCCMPHALL